MAYFFTQEFIPITRIPHELIRTQIENPQNYTFPILKNYSEEYWKKVPSELIDWFLQEAVKAKQVIENKKEIDSKFRMLRHKIVHTDYAMVVSAMIYEQNKSLITIEQALILALLHDIGRFHEPYQDENNPKNHAELSAMLIDQKVKEDKTIKNILAQHFTIDELIEALGEHSKAFYKGDNKFAKFIRDADKITIACEINIQIKLFEKNNVDSRQETMTESVKRSYLEEKIVYNHECKTIPDKILKTIAFIPQLYFMESFQLCKKIKLNNVLFEKLLSNVMTIDDGLRLEIEKDLQIH